MNDSVFIFLGSKPLDNSMQFENHQMRFLENLYKYGLINFKNVIMNIYLPVRPNDAAGILIKEKTAKMQELAVRYSFKLSLVFIKGKTVRSLFKAVKEIREKAEPFKDKIIFSQNFHGGYIGLKIKQYLNSVYFHANLRGLPAEEELFYSRSFIFRRILNFLVLKWIGRKVVPGADSLSVVSGEFKKYLIRKYKLPGGKIIVYPCAYDSRRFYTDKNLRNEFRSKLGIKDHQKVIIYSGSMNKYQLPSKIFQFFENISRQDHENNFVFIFLTMEKESALKLAASFNIKNLIIESASGEDLLSFYNAGDTGIIIRKPDIVNRVASPTKVAEYLSTGNSIILTGGIGDYSNALQNKKFALIKKNPEEFLNTSIAELMNLSRPCGSDLEWIKNNYSNIKISIYDKIFRDKTGNFYSPAPDLGSAE